MHACEIRDASLDFMNNGYYRVPLQSIRPSDTTTPQKNKVERENRQHTTHIEHQPIPKKKKDTEC